MASSFPTFLQAPLLLEQPVANLLAPHLVGAASFDGHGFPRIIQLLGSFFRFPTMSTCHLEFEDLGF